MKDDVEVLVYSKYSKQRITMTWAFLSLIFVKRRRIARKMQIEVIVSAHTAVSWVLCSIALARLRGISDRN